MPSTFLSNHSTNWTSTQKAFVPITWVRLSISSNWFYHHPSHEWLHVIIVSSMLVLVMYLFTKGKKGLFYRNGGDWPIRLIHQSTHRLSIHPWVRASCQFTHSLHDLNHESSYFNNYASFSLSHFLASALQLTSLSAVFYQYYVALLLTSLTKEIVIYTFLNQFSIPYNG